MTKRSKDADASDTGLKAKLAKTFSSLRGTGKKDASQDDIVTADTSQQGGGEGAKQSLNRDTAISEPASITNSDGRAPSKHDQVICLLVRTGGASLDDMVAATGWQKHTVRGFLSGQVKGKLKLNLVSEKTDRGRVYRVIPDVDLTGAGQ